MWYIVDRKIKPLISCVGCGVDMHDCMKTGHDRMWLPVVVMSALKGW